MYVHSYLHTSYRINVCTLKGNCLRNEHIFIRNKFPLITTVIPKLIATKNNDEDIHITNKNHTLARNKSKSFFVGNVGHSVEMTSIKRVYKDRLEFSEWTIFPRLRFDGKMHPLGRKISDKVT